MLKPKLSQKKGKKLMFEKSRYVLPWVKTFVSLATERAQ